MKKALLLALMAGISIALIRIDLSSRQGCPEPDPELICFNDTQCESRLEREAKYYWEQIYPDPFIIEVFVWAVCPFGVCESGMCTNYYDIMVWIENPITQERYEFYSYYEPCETWPCY